MASSIKTIGVVGTGVIGSSWVGLFLAKGLHVVVASPGANAEQVLFDRLHAFWPLLERRGLSPGASLSNCKFVGSSLAEHYGDLDFVQEVSRVQYWISIPTDRDDRMCPSRSKSSPRLSPKSTQARVKTL